MTTAGHRHERLAEEMRHEVSAIVAGELADPRITGLVTVTEVRLTQDLRSVKIFVSVEGTKEEQAETMKGLNAAKGYVRSEVSERLHLRRAPEMFFALDRSEQNAQRVEELLKEVKKGTVSSE
ncbi:MAG: 30S ribosome-binding factor RbfA [Acidobacteria bacterium]|nr:30S ribosome-binding factor RbfA [Acidobacteriota bacterium]